MPQIALTTFLKLCLFSEKRKQSEYRRYLTPGDGYDFYRSLKRCVAETTYGEKTYDYCVGKYLNPLKRASERNLNREGLQSFVNWVRPLGQDFFEPPEGVASSPKGHLKVKLKPEVGIRIGAEKRVVAIWNTRTPELSQFVAGVGVQLLQSNLSAPPFDDCTFSLLDLRKNASYFAQGENPHIAKFIFDEFNWADAFFEENKKEEAA